MATRAERLRDLHDVERFAREAGALILAGKDAARRGAHEKAHGQGPVTEADLAADRHLRAALAARFPDDVVVTEETWTAGTPIPAAHRVWCVDPLDGTKEFIAGRPEYAVMIGLVVDGAPALGVVHQPETGRSFLGSVDDDVCIVRDASGQETALDTRGRAVPESGLRVAVSRSHKSQIALAVSSTLGATTVECGSVGLKVGLVVDGTVDAYLSGSRRIKVWDTAGPAAILRAAGGVFTAVDGRPLAWSGEAAHGGGVRAITSAAAARYGAAIDALVHEITVRVRAVHPSGRIPE